MLIGQLTIGHLMLIIYSLNKYLLNVSCLPGTECKHGVGQMEPPNPQGSGSLHLKTEHLGCLTLTFNTEDGAFLDIVK